MKFSSVLDSNYSHLKRPALSRLLEAGLYREEILCVVLLEDIQTSVDDDLPASVGRNATGMNLLGFIKGIVELAQLRSNSRGT